MKFELDEILTIIEKVKKTDLESFEYQDSDTKIKIRGRRSLATVIGEQAMAAAVNAGTVGGTIPGVPSPAVSYGAAAIGASSADVSAASQASNGFEITSPMVGTFYAAPAVDAEPFVQVGDTVKKGQTVCIVEAMKLMNEIPADVDGVVEEILVENESLVEYGQPLIRIRTA